MRLMTLSGFFLTVLMLTACVRQVPPEAKGVDRLVVSYEKPEQRLEVQALFAQQGLELKQINAAGGKAEYRVELSEKQLEQMLKQLSTLKTQFKILQREHSLILLCCQP